MSWATRSSLRLPLLLDLRHEFGPSVSVTVEARLG